VGESGAAAEIARPLSIIALPDGGACSFYASALGELLRLLTGFEGAMIHECCRGTGADRCRWRATAVGGYD
jgi:predicted hydrocarbon binding protein